MIDRYLSGTHPCLLTVDQRLLTLITTISEKGQTFFLLFENTPCLSKLELLGLLMLAAKVQYLLKMKAKHGPNLS
jgi:hypothetical protein